MAYFPTFTQRYTSSDFLAELVNLVVLIDNPAVPEPPPPPPPPAPAPSGGGGGGGGGGGINSFATIAVSGKAYPQSNVTILKDGQRVLSTIAGPDANFSASLSDLVAGAYTIVVYTEDKKGNQSSRHSFSVDVTAGVTTTISGILLAPTIATDKSEVKRGDIITVLGASAPDALVSIFIHSDQEVRLEAKADNVGLYARDFDTDALLQGTHKAQSRATVGSQISVLSLPAEFLVGVKNTAQIGRSCSQLKGDVNSDCRVNLIDFSLLAYWYKRPLTADAKARFDLSGDGKVSLPDFSIMAFYWTG